MANLDVANYKDLLWKKKIMGQNFIWLINCQFVRKQFQSRFLHLKLKEQGFVSLYIPITNY